MTNKEIVYQEIQDILSRLNDNYSVTWDKIHPGDSFITVFNANTPTAEYVIGVRTNRHYVKGIVLHSMYLNYITEWKLKDYTNKINININVQIYKLDDKINLYRTIRSFSKSRIVITYIVIEENDLPKLKEIIQEIYIKHPYYFNTGAPSLHALAAARLTKTAQLQWAADRNILLPVNMRKKTVSPPVATKRKRTTTYKTSSKTHSPTITKKSRKRPFTSSPGDSS